MIWFTSDWHLDHANIIKYTKRPFVDVDEMEKTIVENFFAAIKSGDSVYHLGDFCFSKDTFLRFTQRFEREYGKTVNFHFIEGNHDAKIKKRMMEWATSFSQIKTIKPEKQKIVLCHYPMLSFPSSHYNAWQLYGHHHTPVKLEIIGKQMNVGVDLHNFNPVSINDVKKYMESQPDNWNKLPPKT